MKISQTLHKFFLHDSGVDRIDYAPGKKALTLKLRLFDWDGEVEDPEEVFGEAGELVFLGVEQLRVAPPLASIRWGEAFFAQVLDLEYKPEIDRPGLEGVYGLIEFGEYGSKSRNEILVVEFLATHFEWIPAG